MVSSSVAGAEYSNGAGYMRQALPDEFIAVHSFSGVSGMSMWPTPNGASASSTALQIAGGEAMVPVSPAPLTPSGLTGVGVTVRSVSKLISASARGSAYSMSDAVSG